MNPKHRFLLFWILLIILVACGLVSCSTVHRLKSVEFKHTDSTATKTTEQIQATKKDSSAYRQTDSSFKELITINFDTAAGQEPANDYEGAELKPLHGPYVYEIAGNTITSARPLKSATIERSGHRTDLQVTTVKQSDSSHKNTGESGHVIKDEKKIAKEITSRRMPFYVSLLLILLVVAAALYALCRYEII